MALMNGQQDELIWSIVKYIFIGLFSIMNLFFLWIIGKYRREHEDMYNKHVSSISDSALKLEEKEAEEITEIWDLIKEIKHDINGMKQEKVNLKVVFEQLEEISKQLKKK